MRSRAFAVGFFILLISPAAFAQEAAKRQLIVPLAEGGFVAFRNETSWADTKKVSPVWQRVPAILGSQALVDDNHVIHRVLEDKAGRLVFGYDLWVAADPATKQFKIAVRPLDLLFEIKLRTKNGNETEPMQPEAIATFPKSIAPQTLDDGDAFSLDLLVNQNTGVKIVDVVSVTFDRANLRDINPRMAPRDFSLDAVELAVRDYRLLLNGNVVGVGKSTKGCTGALVWFYVPERGRFIFSLVPREGYEFQKVGIIEDNRIEFTISGDHYEWLSSAPILSSGGIWNLWVLHDPKYTPLFGSAPSVPERKGVLEKIDDAVNGGAARIGNQKQNTLGNVTAVPRTETRKLPRIMIGGADRIENLWPKGP